ncbi:helix-turn-helix domain-containing protein [Micromonospora sp. R77]|uniref:ATP-binding protein n=1 Tax=Micromonospora sp. R77 TaxID=2925836 RepID=UPI001F5FFEE5|nr:helix-turn-helix domain-containing protein [Micromonospora sp. R77]MCI4061268.1 helix-turn-helix domain-containing protein [Micromonospora sp. R77]
MPDDEAFGPLLRTLRQSADLTLEQLAERSGVSDRAISDMERGVSHGPQTRTVAAIADALRLDPERRTALTSAARAGRRRTAHGRQPTPGRTPTQPDPAPVSPLPAQLPADLAVFAGRRDEVAELVDGLTSAGTTGAPLVSVVTGMAGIGKTTLAVHCAHRLAPRYPDGQLYVDLRGFDPAGPAPTEEALRGFLTALGVPSRQVPAEVDAQAALYRSLLAGRRTLILLDNARDTGQVRSLLPGAAGSLVIVTSRSQLPGLVATHGAHPVPLGLPDRDDAREVLTRRIGRARIAAEPDAVDEIVERCARLPLALAIVAARAATHRQFPLASIADELRRAAGGLGSFTGPEASADARTVFSWSYAALGPAAARLFRLLALHPSAPAAVEAVASLAGTPVDRVRPLLAELTGAHLVTEPLPGRYAFHDLLRAYAAELCADGSAEEREAALRRLYDHYLHSAYAADRQISPTRPAIVLLSEPEPAVTVVRPGDEGTAADWFSGHRPALLATVEAAYADGCDDAAWRLAWTLEQYLERWGHWADWTAALHTALRAARRLDDTYALAQVHRGLGLAALVTDVEDPLPHFTAALALFARLGDVEGQAAGQRGLATTHQWQGRAELALHHAGLALELYRAAGNRNGQGLTLNLVAVNHLERNRAEAALPIVEEAITLLDGVGNRRGEAAVRDTLGSVQHALGRHRAAITAYRCAADLRAQVGDRYQQARTLVRLGDVQVDTGDRDGARETWRTAYGLLTEMAHPDAEGVHALLATVA